MMSGKTMVQEQEILEIPLEDNGPKRVTIGAITLTTDGDGNALLQAGEGTIRVLTSGRIVASGREVVDIGKGNSTTLIPPVEELTNSDSIQPDVKETSVTSNAFETGHVFTQKELCQKSRSLTFLKGYTRIGFNEKGEAILVSPELFPAIKSAQERVGEGLLDFGKGKELAGSCNSVIKHRDRLNEKCYGNSELKGLKFRLATDEDWKPFVANKFKAVAGIQDLALAEEEPANEILQESNLGGREYFVATQGGDDLSKRFATVCNDVSGEKRVLDKRDVQAGGRLFVTVPVEKKFFPLIS